MNKHLEYVGVISPFDLLRTSLKREAIFFDKIAIPNVLKDFIFKDTLMQCPIRSIEYLIDKEIIIDPVSEFLGKDLYLKKIGYDLYEERIKAIKEKEHFLAEELEKPIQIDSSSDDNLLFQLIPKYWLKSLERLKTQLEYKIGIPFMKFAASCARFKQQLDYDRRGIACDLRQKYSINAFPAYSENVVFNDDFMNGQDDVVRLVIDCLPEPDYASVSWEQIIDFRDDPETKKLLNYLRHWINESSKKEFTYKELSQELSYCCEKYEEYIKLQKMKLTHGMLETLLMIPAEMIEGVIRLKPTDTVQALFKFKHQRVKLLEQELKAPGRDLAYLLKARERFDE